MPVLCATWLYLFWYGDVGTGQSLFQITYLWGKIHPHLRTHIIERYHNNGNISFLTVIQLCTVQIKVSACCSSHYLLKYHSHLQSTQYWRPIGSLSIFGGSPKRPILLTAEFTAKLRSEPRFLGHPLCADVRSLLCFSLEPASFHTGKPDTEHWGSAQALLQGGQAQLALSESLQTKPQPTGVILL